MEGKQGAEKNNPEISQVLDNQETLAFLREAGIKPLEKYESGQPVLYVFPESVRRKKEAFPSIPVKGRPTVARLGRPTFIDPNPASRSLRISNHGAAIDYFVIDRHTGKSRRVKSSIGKTGLYVAVRAMLFEANDRIFPPDTEHEAP